MSSYSKRQTYLTQSVPLNVRVCNIRTFYEIVNVFLSEDVRAQMLSKYMSQPDYNFDKVNRASQACGPLVKWAIAQVRRRFLFK
jgi:dynein heavy chain 1